MNTIEDDKDNTLQKNDSDNYLSKFDDFLPRLANIRPIRAGRKLKQSSSPLLSPSQSGSYFDPKPPKQSSSPKSSWQSTPVLPVIEKSYSQILFTPRLAKTKQKKVNVPQTEPTPSSEAIDSNFPSISKETSTLTPTEKPLFAWKDEKSQQKDERIKTLKKQVKSLKSKVEVLERQTEKVSVFDENESSVSYIKQLERSLARMKKEVMDMHEKEKHLNDQIEREQASSKELSSKIVEVETALIRAFNKMTSYEKQLLDMESQKSQAIEKCSIAQEERARAEKQLSVLLGQKAGTESEKNYVASLVDESRKQRDQARKEAEIASLREKKAQEKARKMANEVDRLVLKLENYENRPVRPKGKVLLEEKNLKENLVFKVYHSQIPWVLSVVVQSLTTADRDMLAFVESDISRLFSSNAEILTSDQKLRFLVPHLLDLIQVGVKNGKLFLSEKPNMKIDLETKGNKIQTIFRGVRKINQRILIVTVCEEESIWDGSNASALTIVSFRILACDPETEDHFTFRISMSTISLLLPNFTGYHPSQDKEQAKPGEPLVRHVFVDSLLRLLRIETKPNGEEYLSLQDLVENEMGNNASVYENENENENAHESITKDGETTANNSAQPFQASKTKDSHKDASTDKPEGIFTIPPRCGLRIHGKFYLVHTCRNASKIQIVVYDVASQSTLPTITPNVELTSLSSLYRFLSEVLKRPVSSSARAGVKIDGSYLTVKASRTDSMKHIRVNALDVQSGKSHTMSIEAHETLTPQEVLKQSMSFDPRSGLSWGTKNQTDGKFNTNAAVGDRIIVKKGIRSTQGHHFLVSLCSSNQSLTLCVFHPATGAIFHQNVEFMMPSRATNESLISLIDKIRVEMSIDPVNQIKVDYLN